MTASAAVSLRAVARQVLSSRPLSVAARTRPALAPAFPALTVRPISTSRIVSVAPAGSSTSSSAPAPPKGPIRDENILASSEYVRLVDPKSGALAGPFHTKTILSKLDRSKFFLQQVAPPQPSRATVEYDPTSSPGSAPVDVATLVQFPICKLIDKKEEFDKQRNLKRNKSASASSSTSADGTASQPTPSGGGGSKEVQLTWSVSPNDLGHKLSKAKKEMLRGARINVVVTTKSGGRKYIKGLDPKEDERREQLLNQIEAFLCSPSDGKSAQDADGADAQETAPIARRLQDVDWQRGGSAAVMSFECFRK